MTLKRLPAFHNEPASTGPRGSVSCSSKSRIGMEEPLTTSRRGKVPRVHLHEVEYAHAREEIRTDLMAHPCLCLVQRELAMEGTC